MGQGRGGVKVGLRECNSQALYWPSTASIGIMDNVQLTGIYQPGKSSSLTVTANILRTIKDHHRMYEYKKSTMEEKLGWKANLKKIKLNSTHKS